MITITRTSPWPKSTASIAIYLLNYLKPGFWLPVLLDIFMMEIFIAILSGSKEIFQVLINFRCLGINWREKIDSVTLKWQIESSY